jgi:hypothetical protein
MYVYIVIYRYMCRYIYRYKINTDSFNAPVFAVHKLVEHFHPRVQANGRETVVRVASHIYMVYIVYMYICIYITIYIHKFYTDSFNAPVFAVHKPIQHGDPRLNLNGRETVVRVVAQMLRHEAISISYLNFTTRVLCIMYV